MEAMTSAARNASRFARIIAGRAVSWQKGRCLLGTFLEFDQSSPRLVKLVPITPFRLDKPSNRQTTHSQMASSRTRPSALRNAGNGRSEEVERLLVEGADIHEKGVVGSTALHYAASGGHGTTVKLLLEKGAPVNLKTYDGKTPLFLAAFGAIGAIGGHVGVVQLLVDNGADVNLSTESGETPLHIAAWDRNGTIVQILLDHGADLHARTVYGDTPEDLTRESEAKGNRGTGQVAALLRAVATAQYEAFAMGNHTRLGATSLVQGLDEDLVRMVLEMV